MDEQLEIFELTENDRINARIQKCVSATDNLRRGMFSRHDALFKMYNELKNDLEEAKNEILRLKATANAFHYETYLPATSQDSKLLVFKRS